MKTVIEMAQEAGFDTLIRKDRIIGFDRDGDCTEELEAFAALVRADERSSWPAEMEAMERQVNILTDALAEERVRTKWDVHSCGPTCNRYACVAMREAVKAERDACEALREHEDVLAPVGNSAWGEAYQEGWGQGTAAYRDAIRARGSKP